MRQYGSALTLGFTLLCAAPVQAAFELNASVDRNTLEPGQSLELLVQSSGDTLPGGAPDAALLERDFRILSQGVSTRQLYQNGVRQAQRIWRYVLEPRRSGALQIPALKADGKNTAPLHITVRDGAAAAQTTQSAKKAAQPAKKAAQPAKKTAQPAKKAAQPAKKTAQPARAVPKPQSPPKPSPPPQKPPPRPKKTLPDVFMEGSVDRKTVPVQTQLLYTVQVFTAINISGRVTEPSFAKSIPVHKIAERNYHRMREGRRYTVYEWKYAIFPQKSGVLKIPAARLQARRSGSRQRIRVSNKELRVKVLPIPAGLPGGVWLPAEKFNLKEEWSQPTEPELEVGQPVTRKIKMEARYLLGEQLPLPLSGEVPGMKIYPEKPRFKSRKTDRGMIGSREDTLVLIPTRPGRIELPEIRIPWWDMKKQRLQTSVIPARSLNIVPARGAVLQPGDDGVSSIITAAGEVDNFANEAPSVTEDGETPFLPPLPWLALALLLGCLWGLSTLFWWRERQVRILGQQRQREEHLQALHSERRALEQAEAACRRQDPQQLRTALLEWGRKRWSDDPPHTLRELCRRAKNTVLLHALEELNRSLYQQESHDWENNRLLEALQALRRAPTSIPRGRRKWLRWQQEAVLPPLYKTS